MRQPATKELAHTLIDRLPSSHISAAVELLEKMFDPVEYSLTIAPLEDEAISEGEERAAAQARGRDYSADPDSHRELLAEFGLTTEAFDRMGREPADHGLTGG